MVHRAIIICYGCKFYDLHTHMEVCRGGGRDFKFERHSECEAWATHISQYPGHLKYTVAPTPASLAKFLELADLIPAAQRTPPQQSLTPLNCSRPFQAGPSVSCPYHFHAFCYFHLVSAMLSP
ncbi:hypothetical protein L218DRAFT_614874 [Marasmius fiardii PR-910]|nr:hypothetical protein L218DRAFT_614874 [Marasmius fiardii PR-910]